MTEEKPFLAAAFLCERVLRETDKVLSAMRIVDTFFVHLPPPDLPAGIQPIATVTVLLSFKKRHPDIPPVKYTAVLQLHTPSGQRPKIKDAGQEKELEDVVLPIIFEAKEGEPVTANFIVSCGMPVLEFGLYWFDVLLDGDKITEIPFRLLPQKSDGDQSLQ